MLKKFLYAVCILLILAVIGYYIYEVAFLAVPFEKNLFRSLLIVAGLIGTMVKLASGTAGRSRSLSFYEKMYAEETAGTFENSPALRKKLMKGIRLFQENQPPAQPRPRQRKYGHPASRVPCCNRCSCPAA